MRVRATKSFVGRDAQRKTLRIQAGDEFELPAGVDWLRAGLVVPLGNETAASKPAGKQQAASKLAGRQQAAQAAGRLAREQQAVAVDKIAGIGPATARQLAKVNVKTVADLAAADSKAVVAAVDRASLATVRRWQKAAREMLT